MVALFDSIKNFFRPQEKPDSFSMVGGTQRSKDTQRLLGPTQFFARLKQNQRLTLFKTVYETIPLGAGAVNVLTRMCNKPIIPKSGHPQIDQRMRAIWHELNLHTVNEAMLRQYLIYGFTGGEMVWSPSGMEKIVVIPSPELRVNPDRQGKIVEFLQLPERDGTSQIPRATIPPQKIIHAIRDPLSTFDYYGQSLFACVLDQLESLCKILEAQISVYMRLGKPRYQVAIPAENLTPEEFNDRLAKAKEVFGSLADKTDIYMPAGVDLKIIGAESFGQRFADETRLVVSQILAGVGLPPALLSVVIQGSGGTESWLRQSIIVLQSMLDNIQQDLASAWNCSFWPMMQRLEGLPTPPIMSFERPRLLEQQQEETARQLRWDNDLKEVLAGIRPPEWLAQRCGATEVHDPQALNEFVKRYQSPDEQKEASGEDTQNRTKVTDEKATNNTGN